MNTSFPRIPLAAELLWIAVEFGQFHFLSFQFNWKILKFQFNLLWNLSDSNSNSRTERQTILQLIQPGFTHTHYTLSYSFTKKSSSLLLIQRFVWRFSTWHCLEVKRITQMPILFPYVGGISDGRIKPDLKDKQPFKRLAEMETSE